MKLLLIFSVLSLVNVIGSTFKSILTIKAGKSIAALVNAAYFAFYNIVMVYTVADFPMWEKCAITFLCNLVGVYVVKWVEEKKKPIKMWKIEMAILSVYDADKIKEDIERQGIPCNYIFVGGWTMFNCYCDTCEQSDYVNKLCKRLNGKISAYESKSL